MLKATTVLLVNAVISKRIRGVAAKIIVGSIVLLISEKSVSADSTAVLRKKNIAFVTFGGKENFGSVNYERVFFMGNTVNWSFALGIQPFQPSRKLAFPLSVNAFTKGRLHHLELDLTATFFMDKFHPYTNGWQEDFNKQLYLTPFICYRLQGNRGLILKTGLGPQILFDPPSNDVLAVRTKILQPSFFGSVGMRF
jgi:hypothetical protein